MKRDITCTLHHGGAPVAIDQLVRTVRFTLDDGSWFEVDLVKRHGVDGLSIHGSNSFGIKLDVSNHIWLMPRGKDD